MVPDIASYPKEAEGLITFLWRGAASSLHTLFRSVNSYSNKEKMTMYRKRKPEMKYTGSSCPMSEASIGERCNAGNPPQILIEHPEALIGKELMQKLVIRRDHAVYRCTYCTVVYINTDIRGMERILGYWTPQGFKATA
jgi:hypothetical protein